VCRRTPLCRKFAPIPTATGRPTSCHRVPVAGESEAMSTQPRRPLLLRSPSATRRPLRRLWRVVPLVLACAVVAAQPGQPASRFYEDALSRFERKDHAGAIVQLKNALSADPRNLAAQVLLGRALLATGDMIQAEVSLNEALRQGVNRAEVVVPLAESLLGQGKPQALQGDPRFAADGLPQEVRYRLMLLISSGEADLGDGRAALQTLMAARALAPDQIDSWLQEVPIRIRSRQLREAEQAAARAVALDARSARARYLQGSVAHATGRLDAALAAYAQALQIEPTQQDALLSRAGIFLDQGRVDDAAKDIAVLRQSHTSDPRAAYLEALVLERRGDARGARAALSRVTDLLDPAPMEFYRYRPQMLILGGLAHHGLGQFEKAKPYLEAAQRQQPTSPAAKVLAQIQINDGNLDRATETLEAYLQGNPRDAQAYVLLAGAHQARGRAARAVQILTDAQKRHDTPALRGALGLALVSVGRGAEALPHLEQAVKADPKQLQAARTLGDLYLQRRDPARARTVADTLVRRDAKDPQAHLLLGRVHLAQASAAPAEAAFRQALAIDPSLSAARIGLARVALQRKQPDAAVTHLRDALARDDRQIDAMLELASVLEGLPGQEAEATRLYERAAAVASIDNIRPGLALMAHHLRAGRIAPAQEAVKALENKAPDHVSVLSARGRVALAAGDLPGARQALTRASRAAEFDADLLVQIALMQLQAEDAKAAQYGLTKALQASPGHLQARALQVQAELAVGDVAQADRLARGIQTQFPAKALGHRLVADVALRQGQVPAGIEALRRAQQLEPSSDNLLRLVRATQMRDERAALQLADQWLKSHPTDAAVRRALADAQARAAQWAPARASYEAVLAQHPGDGETWNNLAHVLLALKDAAAAQAAADKALALLPQAPHVLGTAGWAALQNGQVDRALRLLRDARLRDPGNDETRFYLASALAQSGRGGEARQELEAALRTRSRLVSVGPAEQLLATLR